MLPPLPKNSSEPDDLFDLQRQFVISHKEGSVEQHYLSGRFENPFSTSDEATGRRKKEIRFQLEADH